MSRPEIDPLIPLTLKTLSEVEAFKVGLDRKPPVGSNKKGRKDMQVLDAYIWGFRSGLERDFGSFSFGPIPMTDELYNAFLAGLAGAPLDSKDKNPFDINSFSEYTYKTGLRILLLHLGYPKEEIEGRVIQSISNQEELKKYRKEAEELRNELAA